MKRRAFLFTPLLCLGIPRQAKPAIMGGFATEFTQLFNYATLLRQLYQMVQMLRYSIASFKQMSIEGKLFSVVEWGDIAHMLVNLGKNVRQGMGLAATMQNLDRGFRVAYPGYSASGIDFQGSYHKWNQTTMDTLAGVMASIGAQNLDLNNDAMIMNMIQKRGASAEGQDQLLTSGLQIAQMQSKQLMALRQLMMTQTTAMISAQGKNTQKEITAEQTVNNAYGPGVWTHN